MKHFFKEEIMKKLRTKFVCAVLAFCMLLSGTVGAFAADPAYTAQYDWKASKEVYSAIIDDVDKILAGAAFNANTVQEMWKLMPQINDLLSNLGLDLGTGKAEYYVDADEKIFADLPAYAEANSIETVNTDVLQSYFAEHPAPIGSADDFKTAVKAFVNKLISNELCMILYLVIGFAGEIDWTVEETYDYYRSLFGSVDDICEVLGVNQEMSLYDAYDLEGIYTSEPDLQSAPNVARYINNIVDALIPNTVDKAVGIIQNVMLPENSAKLYSAVSNIITKLGEMIPNLETNLGALGMQLDLSAIKDILAPVSNAVKSLPLNEDGSIDWNPALEYLINQVILPELAGMDLNAISFGEGGNGILKFSAVNPDNLAQAADTTDALNVAMHYLYENINANKETIDTLIELILPPLNVTLPQEVTDILNMVTTNTESDAVWNIYSMLHVATGYEAPVMPEDPNQPSDPSDPADPSDPTDPSEPTPDDPGNTDTPSDNSGNKTDDGRKTDVNNKNTANPKLPNTGAEEMGALFVIIPIAAAGAFMLVAALRKRALEK